tara:strand:+ start:69 stop:653 length:585 start_codon:yes stop_codon:yes gene_type:complete
VVLEQKVLVLRVALIQRSPVKPVMAVARAAFMAPLATDMMEVAVVAVQDTIQTPVVLQRRMTPEPIPEMDTAMTAELEIAVWLAVAAEARVQSVVMVIKIPAPEIRQAPAEMAEQVEQMLTKPDQILHMAAAEAAASGPPAARLGLADRAVAALAACIRVVLGLLEGRILVRVVALLVEIQAVARLQAMAALEL